MSPEAHLGLALGMLEHLPMTPPGLSFSSGIPLMMAYSPEALTYQGEGTEACNFQLIKDSTAAAVLNQKMQQLLTVPESTTTPPDLDASTTAETNTMLTGFPVHHPSPTKQLHKGQDSLSEPDRALSRGCLRVRG